MSALQATGARWGAKVPSRAKRGATVPRRVWPIQSAPVSVCLGIIARKGARATRPASVVSAGTLAPRRAVVYSSAKAAATSCMIAPPLCAPAAAGRYNDELGGVSRAACQRCPPAEDSVSGSDACTFCSVGHYRRGGDSPADSCTLCDAIPGVRCGSNATIASLNMTVGHWRHSTATVVTYRCKWDGSWTPCSGGAYVGAEGDGYCAPGYRGPRCELCDGPAYARYFDKLEARCHDCGDASARTVVLVCVMPILVVLAATARNPASRRLNSFNAYSKWLQWVQWAQAVWQEVGMRYKVKVLVGFYQCLAAVPSVYNVQPPIGLEEYTRWIQLLELPSEFERIFVLPTACLGDYQTRIWVGSTWPLVVILACAVCLVGSEFVQQRCSRGADRTLAPSIRTALATGLQRVLPLTLGLTFLVLPSTSTRIFRAFLCETFQYDEETSRQYLYADLTLSCDSDDFEATRTVAFAMLALWPVGIPLLYVVLLWASRNALRTGAPTSLSRATAFLSDDYDYSFSVALAFWEPLEMCRKLTLTGWVLLIRGDAEQARVIAALFVSVTFFGLNLRFKPLRRCAHQPRIQSGAVPSVYASHLLTRRQDDSSLTTVSHLALILIYTSVLAIKTCNLSPDACSSYGFGDSAEGACTKNSVQPRVGPHFDLWHRSHRLVPLLHILRIRHARLPAGLRSSCHRLPHSHAEEAAPIALHGRGRLCRATTSNQDRFCTSAGSWAVTMLPPLPIARMAARAGRV